jgi:hypothetical protein
MVQGGQVWLYRALKGISADLQHIYRNSRKPSSFAYILDLWLDPGSHCDVITPWCSADNASCQKYLNTIKCRHIGHVSLRGEDEKELLR